MTARAFMAHPQAGRLLDRQPTSLRPVPDRRLVPSGRRGPTGPHRHALEPRRRPGHARQPNHQTERRLERRPDLPNHPRTKPTLLHHNIEEPRSRPSPEPLWIASRIVATSSKPAEKATACEMQRSDRQNAQATPAASRNNSTETSTDRRKATTSVPTSQPQRYVFRPPVATFSNRRLQALRSFSSTRSTKSPPTV